MNIIRTLAFSFLIEHYCRDNQENEYIVKWDKQIPLSKIQAIRSTSHKSFSKISKANIAHCKHLIAYFDWVPLDVISTLAIYILNLRKASFPTIMNQRNENFVQ